jgi:hypothetical protein
MKTSTSIEAGVREVLTIPATPGKPIACDMTDASDTPQERLAEYGRLFAHALVGRERTSDGVVFRFKAKPGVLEWAADLVRREAACCPFFSYYLTTEGNDLVWRTTSQAGDATQAMLDEFYALPEYPGDGIEAYFKRLSGRGLVITSPGKSQFTVAQTKQSSRPGLLSKLKSGCGC